MSAFSNLLSGQSSREIGRLLKTVVQKQINQELTDTDISDSEVQTPVKLSNTKDLSLIGDLGAQATFNVATELSNNHYMTFEPDGVDLRMWLKFQNAGTLVDYAVRGIKAYSVGENNLPGTFIHHNDDINVKYEMFSYFNGQSHFAFAKDDPAIQLKNIIVDNNKPFALHMRMKPITFTQSVDDANITIASKIDDDQLRYGYAVTVTPYGHMHFYIRKDYVQYHLYIKDAYSWIFEDPLFIAGQSYNKTNFNPTNYLTTYAYLCGLVNSPDLRFDDWMFTYKPATNQMTVMFNGDTILADSLTSPAQKPYMNLALQDGMWTHTSSTVINNTVRDSSGNAKNGTITGGFTWNIDNGLFNPGSDVLGTTGGMEVTFPNDATLNTLTQFTIAIQYYLWDTTVNSRTYDVILVAKGINVNNGIWIEHIAGSDKVRANIRSSSGTTVSVTSTNPLVANTFNFITFRWKSGEQLKLVVNAGIEDLSASSLSTTITNSSSPLRIGSISKSERSQYALFKFYTIQISEQTLLDLAYAGWHNPLFPTSEAIQPIPEPAPPPVTIPYTVKATYAPVVPSAAKDFRYLNTPGGDNPYFPVYTCPDGVSIVDPIVQRYDVGAGAVIPGSPITESVEVPSEDNSFNVLQRTTTTNEIAGVQIRAPVNRPNPTNAGVLMREILNRVDTAPTFPAFPQPQGMILLNPLPNNVMYSEPNVYIIFEGSAWNTTTTPFSRQQVMTACDTVFNSTHFDALLQYGIRKPKSHTYVTNTTMPLPTDYELEDVEATIEDSKTRGLVPSHLPTSQKNIYMVLASPGKTFTSPESEAGAVAWNSGYWTNESDRPGTITVFDLNTNRVNDTLSRFTRSLFHELVESMASTPFMGGGWRRNPNGPATNGIGNQICDPGEGLNPQIDGVTVGAYWSNIDQKVVPPPTAPTWLTCASGSTYDKNTQMCVSGGAPGPGGGGGTGNAALDKDGVFSLYGTGEIDYEPLEDFGDETRRLDWEIESSSRFVSCELTVYIRMEDPPTDECSGILGGGKHGDTPRCYVVGVGTQNGAVRLRLEENHPDYEEIGQGSAVGVAISGNRWVGYKYVKWNKPDGVQIEVWQDAGSNNTTPSNQWVKLGSWLETRENWRTPPSDHQETFRIDGSNSELDTLEYKWQSLREIKTTDTGNPPVDPGEPEPLPDPPLVGIGADLLDRTIKKASFWMQGGSSPTGTGYCRIWDENNQPVVTMGSFDSSNLSTSDYVRRDFTNNSNTIKMKRGYTIGIEYKTGSTSDYIKLQRRSVNFDSSIVQSSKKYQGPWGINEAFEIKCELTFTYQSPDIEEWHVLGSFPVDVGSVGEAFGAGSPMIGIAPTHVEYRIYRYVGVVAGTVNLDHISATGELKARVKTVSAISLPTAPVTENNFIWENFNYLGKIVAGDRLAVTVEGVGSDAVYVMTNSGGSATNNYDTTRSHLIYKDNTTGWISMLNIDVTGKMASGGNNFEAFDRFSPSKTYIGEKIVNQNSVLHDRRITRKTVRAKKIGTPTGTMTCGIMDTNYVVKAILGTKDVATIGTTGYSDVTFSNPAVSYMTVEGDRLYLLYEGATNASNTIEINQGRDFVDELNSIAFYVEGNNTVDVGNKDMAGTIYIGGELDVNSRSRITQTIEHQNSEYKGLQITRAIIYMYRTTTNTTGTAYCYIRRGLDDEVMTPLGTINVASLSTSPVTPTPVSFTSQSSTYVLDVGDRISVEYDGGNTTDKVGVMVKNVAVTQTTAIYSYVRKYNGVNYSDAEPQYAMVGYYSIGGYTYTPEPNALPDPTPVADKDLTICAGRNKISGFFESIVAECRIYSKDITPAMSRNLYINKYTILPLGSNEVLIPFTFKPSSM